MTNETTEKEITPQVRRETTGNPVVKPAVNIRQDADGYTIEAEMPGVTREDVLVTFEDGKLTLHGRRRAPEALGRAVYRESNRADYRRVFDLDSTVDASKIEASVEQGVLNVRLPKAEAAKPRQIAVS